MVIIGARKKFFVFFSSEMEPYAHVPLKFFRGQNVNWPEKREASGFSRVYSLWVLPFHLAPKHRITSISADTSLSESPSTETLAVPSIPSR